MDPPSITLVSFALSSLVMILSIAVGSLSAMLFELNVPLMGKSN